MNAPQKVILENSMLVFHLSTHSSTYAQLCLHIKKSKSTLGQQVKLTSNLPHEWQVQQQLSPSSYFFLNPIWHGLLQIDSGIPSSESNLNWISEKKDEDGYLYGMNL